MSKVAERLEELGIELWEANESARGIWGRRDSFLEHMVYGGPIFPADPAGLTWGRMEEDGVYYYPRDAFDLVD